MIMKVDGTMLLVEGSFVFVRTCDRTILVLTFHFWNHHEVKTQGAFKANYMTAPTTGTNVLDFLVEIMLQKELKNEFLVSLPRGTVIVVGPHDESMSPLPIPFCRLFKTFKPSQIPSFHFHSILQIHSFNCKVTLREYSATQKGENGLRSVHEQHRISNRLF
ncbi:hypothetical protein P8452_36160 [Trifolium repens]|nr:hypothetical protein P8452_36160 [Trifolium repens]